MYFTCITQPLDCDAWVCGKLWIALLAPFAILEPIPEGLGTWSIVA
jgi:hypothetical protein